MLRVRDPQKSLEYYKFLGLTQINKVSFPENKFDLYFLGTLSVTCEEIVCIGRDRRLTYSSIRWKGVRIIRSALERPTRGFGVDAQLRNRQSSITF